MREQLRRAFARWGLPGRLRVDNGVPWGSWGDFPTDLSLWVIGLGVAVHWNNPRSPRENGVVERSQGTSDRWCEPWTCDSPEELQAFVRSRLEPYKYPREVVFVDVLPRTHLGKIDRGALGRRAG